MYVCKYVCMYVYICVCMNECMYVCMYVYMCVCVLMCITDDRHQPRSYLLTTYRLKQFSFSDP